MEKKIMLVLKYFSFFAYYPTLEEIHTFLQAKISKNSLEKELKKMISQKKILDIGSLILDEQRYTVGEYSNSTSPRLRGASNETMKQLNNLHKRRQISQSKLNSFRFKLYIKLLSIFPQIKLVGLSGSISMMNAGENDDIDLFIITAKNRLFTGRLIALVLAQLLGLRRNREARESQVAKNFNSSLLPNNETMKQWNNYSRNKVCLNLFFDESNLKVPKFKQSEFVGHEVLQMKPIINKDYIYERFLQENEWVYELFPNGKSKSKILNLKSQINLKHLKFKTLNLFGTWNLGFSISNKIESILKNLQLTLINRHRTTEIITPTQLWFHPDDFEKKIKTY